jgi:diacylglycerol kinase (ATP)
MLVAFERVVGINVKNRSFPARLGFAVAGIRHCWRSEKSFRTHSALGAMALLAMVIIRPSAIWWGLVGLVIALVLAFELINSALERLIDHLHPRIHPEIGIVKDMASGAVLVISIGALIVAGALGAGLL